MNTISLIPFIVGLINYKDCINNSPGQWKYGPEYVYYLKVNASSLSQSTNQRMVSIVSALLKCRPFSSKYNKNYDVLQCFLKTAEIDNFEVDDSSIPPNITREDAPGPFDIANKIFELYYRETGIYEIRIDLPIGVWRMNMYRAIANQLNFAFNGFQQKNEQFRMRNYENSTIGQCDTGFEVSKHLKFPPGSEWNSTCSAKLRLETYVYGSEYPLVVMEKTRNTKNCTKYVPYFFGGENYSKTTGPFLMTEIDQSISTFMVAPQSFEVYSISEGLISDSGKSRKFLSREAIDVKLMSIEPALTPLTRLKNYGSTTVFANDPIVPSSGNNNTLRQDMHF